MAAEDGPTPVVGPDGRDFVVVDATGAAVGRWCPHQGADMADGSMIGGAVKCPLHGYIFDVSSGRGLNCRYSIETARAAWDGERWQIESGS